MRSPFIYFVLTLFSLAAFAQSSGETDYWDAARGSGTDTTVEQQKATTFHLTTGTSFGSDFSGGTAFNTYVAPYISHQLNPRWRLSLGTALVNSSFDQWTTYTWNDRINSTGNVTYQQLFVRADYLASDKMMLSGAVYHHVLTLDPRPGELTQTIPGNTYMLGMEYKLARGLTVGVQVSQSRGGGFYSPLSNPMGFGAFNNTFGPFGGW